MLRYSLFLDESYVDAADLYVVGGFIIETDRVETLCAAIGNVSLNLVGDPYAELKYAEEDRQTKALLTRFGKDSSDAREAMALVPQTVGGITFVATIILDPTADQKAGSLKPLSWAFGRTVQQFTSFLHDVGAPTAAGSHEITADRFPDKAHKTAFLDAYRRNYASVPHGWSPLETGVRQFITESDATYCLPLRLADHFAGTVRSWAMAEQRFDASRGAVAGRATGRTRYAVNRYMPYVRGRHDRPQQKGGYGLAIWPEQNRGQLDLWIAHTNGRRGDEIYNAPSAAVEQGPNGEDLLVIDWGTQRSWE